MSIIPSATKEFLIDFNGMSTHLGLFLAWKLGNCIYIYIFCLFVSEEVSFILHSPIERESFLNGSI